MRTLPRLTLPVLALCLALLAPAAHAQQASAPPTDSARLVVQLGHASEVTSVAFSPDGRMALSGSDDGTLKLWDVVTGRELRTFKGHNYRVLSVAFSPDGRTALSGGWDKTLKLWDVATGRGIRTFKGHKSDVWSVAFSPDGRTALSQSGGKLYFWDAKKGHLIRVISGHKNSICVAFSPDGKTVLSGGGDGIMRLWDIASYKEIRNFKGHTGAITSVCFSPNGRTAFSASVDSTLKLWDVATGEVLRTFEGHTDIVWSVAFSPDGRSVLSVSTDGIMLLDLATKHSSALFTHQEIRPSRFEFFKVAFSPKSNAFISRNETARGLSFWDIDKNNIRNFLYNNDVSAEQRFAIDSVTLALTQDTSLLKWKHYSQPRLITVAGFSGYLEYFNAKIQNLTENKKVMYHGVGAVFQSDKIMYFSDLYYKGNHTSGIKHLLHPLNGGYDNINGVHIHKSDSLFISSSTQSINIWKINSNRPKATIKTWDNESTTFSHDGRFVVSYGQSGKFVFYDINTGFEVFKLFSVGANLDWVAVDSAGRFDGTPRGMAEALHFVQGLEVIQLSQLKDRYYEPGLIQKHLGFNPEPLRDVRGFHQVELTPGILLGQASPGRSLLEITLTNRGGGIGRTAVYIDGREAFADVRSLAGNPATLAQQPHLQLSLDLAASPLYTPGDSHYVEVRAYNAAGYLVSRPEGLAVKEQRRATAPVAALPRLYAVVVGVADYANPAFRLTYSAKDAQDMAQALRLGAEKLLGPDRVQVQLLATGTPTPPTHANIVSAFDQVVAQAQPQDILVVYLAGHGVSPGAGDDAQFYFLTPEANSAEMTDPVLRSRTAISSGYLAELASRLKARKYVLIMDACQSGRVVENLAEKRDIPGNTIRALDRLRDRTGSFILTGCAADASSYEATRFGQGVLTYSLLTGMKGAALREGAFVDVQQLFHFAQEQVPLLAGEVGGVQKPQVFSPDGGRSFDIGRLDPTEQQQITVATPKPIFLRSNLTNADEAIGYDDLELSGLMDEALNETAARGKKAPLVFYDVRDFPNAYFLTGRYRKTASGYELTAVVRASGTKAEKARLQAQGPSATALRDATLAQLQTLQLE